MLNFSESCNEVDLLFDDCEEIDKEQYETSTKMLCPIIAPFAGLLPSGGGHNIRSPRVLSEMMS
jgi:hypothetical protein